MTTVRVFFSKTGRAKYISHLDLNRTMARAVRRAGIPLWYTEGFNRHPYLTFAAPLSLGAEGLREPMDLRLDEEMPMDQLAGRLDAVMPEGLHILEAAEARMKPGDLCAARYRLTFSCPAGVLEDFLRQDRIEADKRTKKGAVNRIDLKPDLREAVLTRRESGTEMAVILPCGARTVNPSLVQAALTAAVGREIPCAVLRLELLGPDGQPFA